MRVLVLLLQITLLTPTASHDPFTCAVKSVAFERAAFILGGRHAERVGDALDFETSECNAPALAVKRSPIKQGLLLSSVVLHVSPTSGDDSGTGTDANPLQTLHEAQRRLRALPISERQGATVILGKGTHFLKEPLVFTPADSGMPEKPIKWKANSAVVSGGRSLDCKGKWQMFDSDARIYRCKMPSDVVFDALFIAGMRQVRARYPNGSPLVPNEGYASGCKTESTKSTGTAFKKNMKVFGADGENLLSTLCVFPQDKNLSVTVKDTSKPRTVDLVPKHKMTDQTQFWGTHFDETYNYPFWKSSALTSILLPPSLQGRWRDATGAVVKMKHPAGFGSWAFEVSSQNGDVFNFSKGGVQEARGLPAYLPGGCGAMYVENLPEELDAPGEWWLDVQHQWLYFIPLQDWSEAYLQQAEVIAPQLQQLIEFRGTRQAYVHSITLEGFNITHAAPTYLKSYEVPSGGDWSIHRGAAVFLDGVEGVQLRSLSFDQVDGNGIFFSNHAVDNLVQDCDFWRVGDSAISLVGSVPLGDARMSSGAAWPIGNALIGNWIEEVGVNMKQTSCIFQSLAQSTLISDNVCYNGPRAGINFNDGFMGGSIVEGNVVFNMVRETGDHGTFNSWDRREFLLPCKDGSGDCFTPQTIRLRRNMFIGPAGWNLDHDDGSSQYEDFLNVVLFGTIKFRDGVMRNMTSNLLVQSSPAFQVTGFDTNFWVNNTIVSNLTVKVCAPSHTGALTGTRYLVLKSDQAIAEETSSAPQCWPTNSTPPCICDEGVVRGVTEKELQQIVRDKVAPFSEGGSGLQTSMLI